MLKKITIKNLAIVNEINLNFSKGLNNNAISDIWARKKINNLLDSWYLGDKKIKQDIVDLSIKHNLISKFTSFVAVEQIIVNPSGNSVVANIHTDLPDGWNYEAVFGNQNVKMAKNNVLQKNKNINLFNCDKFIIADFLLDNFTWCRYIYFIK